MKRYLFILNLVLLVPRFLTATQNAEGFIIALDIHNIEFTALKEGRGDRAGILVVLTSALKSSSPILMTSYLFVPFLFNKEILHTITTQWMVFGVNNYFLFIPKDKWLRLQSSLNVEEKDAIDITKSMSSPSVSAPVNQAPQASAVRAHVPLPATLEKIFKKKKLAADENSIEWMFYLVGHGMYKTASTAPIVADLSFEEFRTFLDFLEKKVDTKLLIYTSCYGGGTNAQELFKKEEQAFSSNRAYRFPILFLGLNNIQVIIPESDRMNFTTLYESLKAEKFSIPDYYTILKIAGFIHPSHTGFPQIRLPGTDFFSIDVLKTKEQKKEFVVISKTMAETREKPLIIQSKDETSLLFIAAHVVPFTLDMQKSVRFSFMFPETTSYRFKEIQAKPLTLETILQDIAYIAKGADREYYIYIDTLTCVYKDEQITFSDCIIHIGPYNENSDSSSMIFYGTVPTEPGFFNLYATQKAHYYKIDFKLLYTSASPTKKIEDTTTTLDYMKKFSAPPVMGGSVHKALVPALSNKALSYYINELNSLANNLLLGLKLSDVTR